MPMSSIGISQLVAAPLLAAAAAQKELSKTAVDYINSFIEDDKMQSTEFQFPAGTIRVPTLALAPIPSIAVRQVVIDFQMEVSSASQSKDGEEVKIEGSVSSSASNTRSTNQSAKYQIHVEAGKEEKSEALSRILDLMAESIELRQDSAAITEPESKSESIADQEAAETDETDQI